MRIKLLTSIAGPHFSHKPGDVVVWPDPAEAVRLCEAGHAIPIPEPMQTATKLPPLETADLVSPELLAKIRAELAEEVKAELETTFNARVAEEVARQLEEGTGEDDDADAEGDSKESKPDAKGKPDAKSDSKESKPDAKGKGKGK